MNLVTVETYVGEEGRKEGNKVQTHKLTHTGFGITCAGG